MPTRNDTLRDRLSRYREINISVTGRKSGRAISIPIWFVADDKNYTSCRSTDRTHSGTKTCSSTRRFASMPEAQRLNSRLKPSLTPNMSRPWLRDSEESTGPSA